MSHTNKVTFAIVSMTLPLVFVVGACRDRTVVTPVITAPTPSPAIDRTQLAPETQQNAYQKFAPGLLARTIFKAEQTGGVVAEIWDLLVGPGQKTEAVTLPGGAVFEIRSGDGVITIAGKPRELKTGTTFSLDEGESFQIENRSGEEAISIRAVVIRGSQN